MAYKDDSPTLAEYRDKLLETAIEQAVKSGYLSLQMKAVARDAGVPRTIAHGAVGSTANLQAMVIRQAVKRNHLSILADALANGHTEANACTADQRAAAAEVDAMLRGAARFAVTPR